MIARMNNDTHAGYQVIAAVSAYALIFAVVFAGFWVIGAFAALLVAPSDRHWSFFWCTLLFLGPIGIVAALLAQPRPDDDD
jgi:hypothetical protein